MHTACLMEVLGILLFAMFRIRPLSVFLALTFGVALVTSCNDPKAANKSNFKRAIQATLDKGSSCLSVELPAEPRSMFDGKPRPDPHLDALVSAGLVSKTSVMMQNSASSLFGGPKQLPGSHYDFTAEGRKYAAHPQHSALSANTQTLCYGVPEVIDVVRYSKPGNAFGQTMTDVTYTYALKSLAPWVTNPVLVKEFPELGRVATREHPSETHTALVKMNDGWRSANSM